MGWFNKKEEKSSFSDQMEIPELPTLPELPELPPIDNKKRESLPQLPSFPFTPIGQKFSQNAIKETVSDSKDQPMFNMKFPVERRGEKRVFRANEFQPIRSKGEMMPRNLKVNPSRDYNYSRTEEVNQGDRVDFEIHDFENNDRLDHEEEERHEIEKPIVRREFTPRSQPAFVSKHEPVYVRIDKFEEAMRVFEKTKKEIAEIEKTLRDIAEVRANENKELDLWQSDVLKIKDQVEKVNRDIFSKIE